MEAAVRLMDHTEVKLITAILYRGGGSKVLKALHGRGINTASMNHARGSSIGDPAGKNGIPVSFEKEIVTVVVPAGEADEVFEMIFHEADLNRPHGGLLYMEDLKRSVPYVLPDLPKEEETQK